MFIISLSEMVSLGTRDVFIRAGVGGTSDSPTCGPHSHVAATCHVTRHGPCRERRGGTHFSHFVPQVTAQRYCFLHTFSRLSFDMNAEGRKEGKERKAFDCGQDNRCLANNNGVRKRLLSAAMEIGPPSMLGPLLNFIMFKLRMFGA